MAKEEVSRGKRPRGAVTLISWISCSSQDWFPTIHDGKYAPFLSPRKRDVALKSFYFPTSELRIRVHWSMVLVATVENLLDVSRDTSRSQPSSGKKSMSSGRSPVSACLQARLAVFTGRSVEKQSETFPCHPWLTPGPPTEMLLSQYLSRVAPQTNLVCSFCAQKVPFGSQHPYRIYS